MVLVLVLLEGSWAKKGEEHGAAMLPLPGLRVYSHFFSQRKSILYASMRKTGSGPFVGALDLSVPVSAPWPGLLQDRRQTPVLDLRVGLPRRCPPPLDFPLTPG